MILLLDAVKYSMYFSRTLAISPDGITGVSSHIMVYTGSSSAILSAVFYACVVFRIYLFSLSSSSSRFRQLLSRIAGALFVLMISISAGFIAVVRASIAANEKVPTPASMVADYPSSRFYACAAY
jgi:hypothetical protein